jgi:hypothetical protein
MGVLPYSQATYVDVTELGNSVFGTILGGSLQFPGTFGPYAPLRGGLGRIFTKVGWRFVAHATTSLCFESLEYLPMLFIAALTNVSSLWLLGLFGPGTSSNSHSH